MGVFCSNPDKDDASRKEDENEQGSEHYIKRSPSRLVKKTKHQHRHPHQPQPGRHFSPYHRTRHAAKYDPFTTNAFPVQNTMHSRRRDIDSDSATDMISAQIKVRRRRIQEIIREQPDHQISRLDDSPVLPGSLNSAAPTFADENSYFTERGSLLLREKALGFDFTLEMTASPKERRANIVVQRLKLRDKELIYDAQPRRKGWGGQEHSRFPGDHFLFNVDLIKQTAIFALARMMPKGAHLHIHFNACLLPGVLLNVAKGMERMFIRSDVALDGAHALERCKIEFSIRGTDFRDKNLAGNLFDASYNPEAEEMKFADFLAEFPRRRGQDLNPMEWLEEKLTFNEEEVHNSCQTVVGAWEKFNGRTKMMKGLFNYETAYRTYTKALLEDFVRDNIQYAEIRPNFMMENQLWSDDGAEQKGNRRIMEIIKEEYEAFQRGKPGGYFGGLKIIYCTPRSFPPAKVEQALAQCLKFKLDPEWKDWIAGFDLVGEEGQGRPLRDFAKEFIAFQQDCQRSGVTIPFLFHCGETLETGTDTDENLIDAVLLGSKRIGHGFALARHPVVMEMMKQRNVCLEVCPISNEILGLTPRMNGHAVYNLLANNVHCTVNSDNGTLFKSSLSHDFYQVMIGKSDMTLHGWRQLIEWSLEHSCMDDGEREEVTREWLRLWDQFLDKILEMWPELASEI